MKKLLVISLSTILLTACVTDPRTGESRISNAGKGAGIGAAVGAGAGTLFGGNDLKNAGFGALAGSAVGAAVGYYMDKQEEEIQQSLQGTGIEVQRTAKNTLNLRMPSKVTFDIDSATLTPKAQKALNNVARVLNNYPESTIKVTGHTDDTGSDSHNQTLSENRAASVANYLAEKGVSDSRLSQSGMGETMPKFPNDSEENRAKNRRVEIAIVANNNAGANQQPPQGGYQEDNQNNYQPNNYLPNNQGNMRKQQRRKQNNQNNRY
jgi:outer membrane protein OmpA-like peptidoglycan-associated protein